MPNDEKEYSFFRYEMVKEQLLIQFMISSKEIFQVEYSRHRIPVIFIFNQVSAFIAK